jgi:hypothetical protein
MQLICEYAPAFGWHWVQEFHVPLCLPEYIGNDKASCCKYDAGFQSGFVV